jgi:hypothetical protein
MEEHISSLDHESGERLGIRNDAIYGGWYRLLPDGRMELLALANMRRERRLEHTPHEQARGMLAEFIKGASPNDRSMRTQPGKGHTAV